MQTKIIKNSELKQLLVLFAVAGFDVLAEPVEVSGDSGINVIELHFCSIVTSP
jgi:hypothetical protein